MLITLAIPWCAGLLRANVSKLSRGQWGLRPWHRSLAEAMVPGGKRLPETGVRSRLSPQRGFAHPVPKEAQEFSASCIPIHDALRTRVVLALQCLVPMMSGLVGTKVAPFYDAMVSCWQVAWTCGREAMKIHVDATRMFAKARATRKRGVGSKGDYKDAYHVFITLVNPM